MRRVSVEEKWTPAAGLLATHLLQKVAVRGGIGVSVVRRWSSAHPPHARIARGLVEVTHHHGVAPGETFWAGADVDHVGAVVGGEKCEVVAQTAHWPDDGRIARQIQGDEASDAALGER